VGPSDHCPLRLHGGTSVLSMKRHHGSGASGSAEAPGRGTEIDESLCQCPVCLEVMFGKIFMCPEGHGICAESCFKTLPLPRKCPQCRKAYGATPSRGIMVEQIVGALQWSCKHGCGLKCSGAQMAAHQAACLARPVRCPDCDDLVVPASMLKHFTDKGHNLSKPQRLWRTEPASCTCSWTYKNDFKFWNFAISIHMEDEGSDDLVRVVLLNFADEPNAMVVVAYHYVSPRRCKVSFGDPTKSCITFQFASLPWHEMPLQRLKFADVGKGLVLDISSAALLCDSDDKVPIKIEIV